MHMDPCRQAMGGLIAATALTAWGGGKAAPTTSAGDDTGRGGVAVATVYGGGDIVTMVGDSAQYAEALVVKDGTIAFVGGRADADREAGAGAIQVDLAGRTLLPGFIDGHGHLGNAIEFQRYVFLRKPGIKSIPDMIAALQAHSQRLRVKPGEWIVGNGYDPNLLAEKRHPTADDLDQVSTANPVMIIHASGHLGTANHAALKVGGYDASSPDPAGGAIGHVPGSKEPNGLLEENAYFNLVGLIPSLTSEQMVKFTELGTQEVAAVGLTTVTEAGMKASQLPLLMDAARRGALPVDVVAYAADQFAEGLRKVAAAPASMPLQDIIGGPAVSGWADTALRTASSYTNGYSNRLRIGGLKLWSDGSPLGGTAYLSKPYSVRFPGKPASYRGLPTASDAELSAFVNRWFDSKFQILIHANGDAAADQFLNAIEAAEKKFGKRDRRPVVIHCALCREDQLVRMKALGVIPSFYSSVLAEGGDIYAGNIGMKRAGPMQPAGTAQRLGMLYTIHNDSPLVPWDILPLVAAAVNRQVHHTGAPYGPEEKLTPYQALLAVTRYGAYQIFEEKDKGTLEAGKRADLVMLEQNPLKVDPSKIKDIKVTETIKDGKTIWKAGA